MMEGESSFRGEWAVGSEGDPEVLYVNAWLCYVCVCTGGKTSTSSPMTMPSGKAALGSSPMQYCSRPTVGTCFHFSNWKSSTPDFLFGRSLQWAVNTTVSPKYDFSISFPSECVPLKIATFGEKGFLRLDGSFLGYRLYPSWCLSAFECQAHIQKTLSIRYLWSGDRLLGIQWGNFSL